MKTILIASLLSIILVSCSSRKEYNDEDYKQQQVNYEKKKAELNRTKGEFFKANKTKLMVLVQLVDELKDTTKSFEGVLSDSTYYKNDVVMNPLNFRLRNLQYTSNEGNVAEANAVFLHRLMTTFSNEIFSDIFKELKTCYDSNNDLPCFKLKEDELKAILDLKYAFIVDEIIKVNPVIKSSKEFESGLYLSRIICYDIINKNPMLSFVVAAQNSDEISAINGLAEMKINQDFNENIKKEISKACKKHFLFN